MISGTNLQARITISCKPSYVSTHGQYSTQYITQEKIKTRHISWSLYKTEIDPEALTGITENKPEDRHGYGHGQSFYTCTREALLQTKENLIKDICGKGNTPMHLNGRIGYHDQNQTGPYYHSHGRNQTCGNNGYCRNYKGQDRGN